MTQTTDHLLSHVPGDPRLTVRLETTPGVCRLILSGELCGSSIAALDAQVDQLGATPCDEVIVDISRLDSIDERGAGVLVGLRHYVEARGGTYAIVGASRRVDRVIRDFNRNFGSGS